MKDKIFGVLQRMGRNFMPLHYCLWRACCWVSAARSCNETMLAAYGLNSVIHPDRT